jgi:hypothetical protein
VIRTLTPQILKQIGDAHLALFGKTRVGKSKLLEALALAIAHDSLEGFTFICPHGTAREVAERLANPANGCQGRIVHVLDPNSTMAFGANPFETYEESWAACHDAALLWTSSVANHYATAIQETPRLETNFYVLGMFAAQKKLTLIELLPALSLAGESIRDFLLSNFNNHAVSGVLSDLHQLASRSPSRFLEQIDSCKNRLVRWLGDKRLARIFGQQKGLNARAVMDAREIVLIDLSSLAAEDAAFLSTILTCRYFSAAKRRRPNESPRHRFIVDEAAASICDATAQMLDQLAKYGVLGVFALQRLTQLIEKGEFITGALMVNTCKIVFNTPDHESARILAEQLFTGYVDLQEWKPASIRPVAVGNEKVVVRGKSRTSHQAHSRSRAEIDSRSWARASAAMTANMFSAGTSFGSGESASFSYIPPEPLLSPPTYVGASRGENNTRQSSSARASANGRSFSTQYARGRAQADAHADMQGASEGFSENESYVTRYQDLPTQMYTLEEQLHRLTGEIMTLPRRECFVKLEGRAPFRARTADVAPAFKSLEFKSEWLPRYLETTARRSPYLVPADKVDADISARLGLITSVQHEPEPDFAEREPMPIIDAPEDYARDYLRRRSQPTRPTLRILDGGKDGDNSSDA